MQFNMAEQETFDYLKGQFFDPKVGPSDKRKYSKRVLNTLGEYQDALIYQVVLEGERFEEASLPYVLATRHHKEGESLTGIASGLGLDRNTIRAVYKSYSIPILTYQEWSMIRRNEAKAVKEA